MTAPSERNSFRGFLDVMSEMNRMQHHWMHQGEATSSEGRRTHATAWVPTTDIYARSGDLVIRCELPGLKRNEVHVSASSGVLTISGARSCGFEEREVTYYTRERTYGAFRRSMILPENVNQADISASFNNGLLEIIVAGAAASKLHDIDIKSDEPD